jgi:hypothetical protein
MSIFKSIIHSLSNIFNEQCDFIELKYQVYSIFGSCIIRPHFEHDLIDFCKKKNLQVGRSFGTKDLLIKCMNCLKTSFLIYKYTDYIKDIKTISNKVYCGCNYNGQFCIYLSSKIYQSTHTRDPFDIIKLKSKANKNDDYRYDHFLAEL